MASLRLNKNLRYKPSTRDLPTFSQKAALKRVVVSCGINVTTFGGDFPILNPFASDRSRAGLVSDSVSPRMSWLPELGLSSHEPIP